MSDDEALLMAYADGELDAQASRSVEARLATDPAARATVAMFQETSALLRAACDEHPSRLAAVAVPREPARPRRRAAIAAAACLAVSIGFAAGAAWRDLSENSFLDEIAQYHAVFSREGAHLVELPAERVADVGALLGPSSRIVVPDLSGAGLRFAGGRLLVIDTERVAELMYTRDAGLPVALCVVRRIGNPAPVRLDRRGDLRVASWRDREHAFVVVGELDEHAIRDIALRGAAQVGG